MHEEKLRKRNFRALTFEGSFFFAGLSFIDMNAVIPVFIFAYTQSVLLAGLATTINFAASITMQTIVGPYVRGIKNKPRYITLIMALFRPLPFLMIPVLFAGFNPWLTTGIFLIIYTLHFAGNGMIEIPWTDLFGRTIQQEKRGLLLGYQQLIGGLGALLAGYIVKFILDNPNLNNDQRYAIIFGCSALALSLSVVSMSFARDLPHKIETRKTSNWHYYRKLPYYLRKNKIFSKLALVRIFASIAIMIAPFVILFGEKVMNLAAEDVSTLVFLQIAGGLIGGIIWGKISGRFGNHRVILASQYLSFLIACFAIFLFIFSSSGFPSFILWPLVLINGINMGSWLGFLNYTIDIVDEDERTIYLLISNLITFPFVFLPFLAGVIAEYFSYLPIFIISGLAALAAIAVSRLLKQSL